MNKNVLTKNQDEENIVINKLSNALQDELKREVNFKRIKLFSPIFSNFSQTILYNLLLKIQEINITPNEQIIKSGTLDDCSIYVVSAGEVQISMKREDDLYGGTQNEEKVIKILKKGEIFGEISFFTGEARKATAKSVDFGQLYKISRKDFIQLLQGRSLDGEKFAVLKDSLLLYKQFEKISLKCYICQSQTHLSTDCNKIHLSLVKRKVLLPELKNHEQARDKEYKRHDRKHRMSSINTLQLQKDCWIALEQFIQHNYEEIDQYESEFQINDYSMTFDDDEDIQNLLQPNTNNQIDQSGDEDTYRNEIQYNQTGRASLTGNSQHQSQQNQNISPKLQNQRISEHKSPKTPTTQHISPKLKRQSSLIQNQSPNLQHQSPLNQKQSQSQQKHNTPSIKRQSLLLNKSQPQQYRQQGTYSMNSIPSIQQWLPNKMQQVTEGKNFHDYMEIFNKEMRIQQKTTDNQNTRKQGFMQMANILKEMNKQRQGHHSQLKKQIQGTEDLPVPIQAPIQQKSYEKAGDFLIPDDIQLYKSTQKSEISQPSQLELTSNYASDSEEERNVTDENKKTLHTLNKQKEQLQSDDIIEDAQEKYNKEDEKQNQSGDLIIDESIEEQRQLPSFHPNLNLQSHYDYKQENLKQQYFKSSNLQNEEQILQYEDDDDKNIQHQISKQKEQISPLNNKKNLSQSALRTHSSQKIINQDEKYRKPSIGYLNYEGIQVSIDCSSPSQATSITSNMRGFSHKKVPTYLEERRISNLSSINAKRESRDSIYFRQHNLPYLLNSPYFQSPKNINGFNFSLPYMDQTQLSAIIEDYDLMDEKIGEGEINPQIFFAFQKKPNTNIQSFNNSPQFNQLQYRQRMRSNSFYNQNQSNFQILQTRNYPSFSQAGIPQNGFFQSFEYQPQQTQQSPQSNRTTLLASKNMKWADIRRKSMFATMHTNNNLQSINNKSPSNRNNSQSINNNSPSIVHNNTYSNSNNFSVNYNNSPSLQNYLSEQQIQLQQINPNFQQLKNILPQQIIDIQNNEQQYIQQTGLIQQFSNLSKQNSGRKRKQSMRINNKQLVYQAGVTHNKRSSILKNPSKFGQTTIPQVQNTQQIVNSQFNLNNSPTLQYAISHGLVNPLNQGFNLIPNNQVIFRPSQQLNLHQMKLEQQYMDQNIQLCDAMKLYKLYFVLGNYDVVLAKIEQQRKKSNKKPPNLGQIRRFFTRSQKEKTFNQFSSFKVPKNNNFLLNSSNPSQNNVSQFNPSQNLNLTQKLNPSQFLNPSLNPQPDQSIDMFKKMSFMSYKPGSDQIGESIGVNLPLNKIKSEMY